MPTPLQVINQVPGFTESRKRSLYSNFARLREDNPDGFEANVRVWRQALDECVKKHCFADSTVVPAGPGLLLELADPKNGKPEDLFCVFDEEIAQGRIYPLSQYLKSSGPVFRQDWSPPGILRGIGSWALSKVVNLSFRSGASGSLKPEKYVVGEIARARSQELLAALKAQSAKLGSTFSSKVFDFGLVTELVPYMSATDVEVCVLYLARELREKIAYDPAERILVIGSAISEQQRTIVGLRRQIRVLETRGERLTQEIADLHAKAKSVVRTNAHLAKHCLMSKARAEKSLSQTLQTQAQLEVVLAKVDEASDQQATIAALEQSAKLLEQANSQVGGIDRVSDLMEKLQDGIQDTDDIAQQLSGMSLDEVDDHEIDQELEELEAQVTADRLGSVPTGARPQPQEQPQEQTHEQPHEKEEQALAN